MATLRRDVHIDNTADRVWDALRDFHAVDTRVAPGFVMRSERDGDTRIITFANGSVAREDFVSSDDVQRRVVYSISNERLKHYNGAVQVFEEPKGCRVVWTIDLLPDTIAPYVEAQMGDAVTIMKPTLEKQ